MPMPKPEMDDEGRITNLSVNGKVPKTLVKVEKVFKKDHPNIANQLVELARKAAASEG